jgi:hypothetical protein
VPDSIAGLPLHPLLVHATVVIVPAAALSVLLAALWPRFRRWAGLLPLGLAMAGLILDPLATSSGESLEHQMDDRALIEKHSELADGLLPWMIVLVVVAAVLYGWHWRQSRRDPGHLAGLGAGADLRRCGGGGGGGGGGDVGACRPDRPQRCQGRVVGRRRAVGGLGSREQVIRRSPLLMLA